MTNPLFSCGSCKNQRGAAMLELAVAVPVFMGLLLAIVDFGAYFNAHSVLLSAAYNCAKASAANTCASTIYTSIIQESVEPVISSGAVTTDLTKTGATGTNPIKRYKVTLKYTSAPLSLFTSALGMYPLYATGVAHCPPP